MEEEAYILEWVNPENKQDIVRFLKKNERQTMNFRMMTSAKFVVAKYQGEIIGSGGIDIHYIKPFPELFSFFVLPEFRKRGVGMALELARYSFAVENGLKKLFIRIERGVADSLLDWRQSTNSFSFVKPSDDFVTMCEHCEFFQNRCDFQRFMVIDVENRMKGIVPKIGQIDSLPKKMNFINQSAKTATPVSIH